MAIKAIPATDQHRAFREALIKVSRQHAATMPADELLATVAWLVGQVIALQDQRRYTPDAIMQLVMTNIEAGNESAIAHLRDTPPAGRA